jgi:transmembrane sensor
MYIDQELTEELLPRYFEGTLSEADSNRVEVWRSMSPGNEEIFNQTEKVWRSMHLLSEMERYDPQKALQQINRSIRQKSGQRWWMIWQRVAAILVIPLLIAAVWLSLRKQPNTTYAEAPLVQTFSTPPGVKSGFILPDSTSVWLNSSSSVTFPSHFTGDFRQVDVTGEVFFDVKNSSGQPFIVSLGKLNVRVLGTRFNVINYANEDRTEVILQKGKVDLCTGTAGQLRTLSELSPGEMAVYKRNNNAIDIRVVDTEKYVSWINGKLIFKDDQMDEVVRKLNRWFNVNIEVADPAILEYVYTATFQDESIDQILELLTMSAPIRYQVIQREKQDNGTFTAKRIILRKRR